MCPVFMGVEWVSSPLLEDQELITHQSAGRLYLQEVHTVVRQGTFLVLTARTRTRCIGSPWDIVQSNGDFLFVAVRQLTP